MTIPLRVLEVAEPADVLAQLDGVLAGDFALLPVPSGTKPPTGVPATVDAAIGLVIHTSGSTGTPKSVALGREALIASAEATAEALGGVGQWVSVLPAHLVSGIHTLLRSTLAGVQPVIGHRGSFSPAALLDDLDRATAERVYVSLVPAQLHRLIEHLEATPADRFRAARFAALLVGGQGVPPAWLERAGRLGLPVVRSYGSTETSGGCVYDGRGIGATVVRISDGEIQLSGPTLAREYLGDPAKTAASFLSDAHGRWYRTGDLGRLDDGVLTVLGRRDNVIISGGTNVALDSVERVVRGLDGYAEAVVLGVDSAEWGQVPVVVVPESDVSSDLTQLRRTITDALGRAAAPARILRLPSIPELPGGKPDRVLIADMIRNIPSDDA
ncbi:AMP-binding protein [Lysinibacter cavernae]|uniref:O-succinylbenzoic acid--CoA ligase n=1 Tax=Lysinibacter cavernae TaxID=1640652 RepID=A0A7X5TUW8_9MICO|nr:AMP-binding protein [Lysinibacter cavernae]NIH54082.1 O-succinylbenzoic acid--CoA ligase [Lysinibacter cavernae]